MFNVITSLEITVLVYGYSESRETAVLKLIGIVLWEGR